MGVVAILGDGPPPGDLPVVNFTEEWRYDDEGREQRVMDGLRRAAFSSFFFLFFEHFFVLNLDSGLTSEGTPMRAVIQRVLDASVEGMLWV